MTTRPRTVLHFLDYVLDAANARVTHGARVLDLRPKTLAVLEYLAANPQRLVTKQELLEAVWSETAVTEWVLTGCMRELREALGEDAREPRIIETVHRRGYRFIAELGPEPALSAGSSVPSPESVKLQSLPHSVLGAQHSAPAAPLVGRGADLEMLNGCWQRALGGEREIVFVIGEAGIGKTALVDAFLRLLADRLATCLIAHGQCIEQHGAGEPYLPVLEAFGRLCAQPSGAPLLELLRRHAPAWLVQLPGLLEPAECEVLERRLGGTSGERMLREMAAVIAALPAPLVLVLEDLHWSDHATLDLVSTLAQRRDPARLLLIGTYRPVEVTVHSHPLRTVHQDLRVHARCQDLWLKPLTEAAVSAYLEVRWPTLTAPAELARVVHEHTEGNPLFLVNIADYLAANGAVVEVDGRWELRTDAAVLAAAVPPGLRQLIAAHIERLAAADRTALEAASLAGRRFSAALVSAGLDADVVDIEERLAHLADNGVMVCSDGASEWPDGTTAGAYRFNHFLYQSVLRDRVPPARRQQLHERIAARLERAYAGQLAEVSAELAFHLEAAGQAERAVPYLEEAAARAIRRGAHREAASLLEHGLTIIDRLPRTPERTLRTIRLCMALGPALFPTRGYADPNVERVFERARQLSEESKDPVQLFQTLCALAASYINQARLDRAQEAAQQLERLLPALPMPPFVFAGSLIMGIVKHHTGSLSEARQLLEQAISLGDVPLPPLSIDLHVLARSYLALVLSFLGHPDQARARIHEAASRAAASARQYDRSFAAHIACYVHLLLRDIAGLAAAAEQASAFEDFPAIAAVGRLSCGRVLSASGEHGRAIAAIREGINAYRATGERISLPILLATLAEAHAAAGDGAAALACVGEARATAESAGQIHHYAELHRLEGALHAASHDRAAAEACFRRAITLAREHGERWWELRTTTSWARLALEPGTPVATRRAHRDELARLVASFTEGFDTTDLQDAQQLLAALA